MILEIQRFQVLPVIQVMRAPSSILAGLTLIGVCSCHADEEISLALVAADVNAIVEAYPTWGGPVDFQLRFGPVDCFMPPVQPRFSESDPSGPHAEKLYLVHAYDATSYAGVDYSNDRQGGMVFAEPDPEDPQQFFRDVALPELSREWQQILVKEAFVPTLAGEELTTELAGQPSYVASAERGESSWLPGESAGLFLMLRTARDTPGTDEGWVYATVHPDGAVGEVGEISSCADCHRRAGDDRMFGLPGISHEPFVSD